MYRPSSYLLKPQSLTNDNAISWMDARAIFTANPQLPDAVPERSPLSVIVTVLELLETDQIIS
jgi:hypothetical protein